MAESLDQLVAEARQVLADKALRELDEPIRLASGQLSHHFIDGKAGLARAADCSWFFVRKEPKDRGTGRQIEGADVGAGWRVLVVEDVVSTGGSLFKAIDVLTAAGATVVGAATLIDRGGGAAEILAGRGIPYFPVATHTDLGIPPVVSAAALAAEGDPGPA